MEEIESKIKELTSLICANTDAFDGIKVWENIPDKEELKKYKRIIQLAIQDKVKLRELMKKRAKEEEKTSNYYVNQYMGKQKQNKNCLADAKDIIDDILTTLSIGGIIGSSQLYIYSQQFNQVDDDYDKLGQFNAMIKNRKNIKEIELPYTPIDVRLGQCVIVAGQGGVGKTDQILKMATTFAKDGYDIDYFNLEITQDEFWERICSSEGMGQWKYVKNSYGVEKPKFFVTDEELAYVGNKYNEKINPRHVLETKKGSYGNKHILKIEKIIAETKSQIIFIDYIGEVVNTTKMPEHEHYANIAQRMKEIAVQHNKLIIMLGTLNKYDKEKRIDQDDIKGGAGLKHSAHVLIALRYHEEGVLLDILKDRNGGSANSSWLVKYHRGTKIYEQIIEKVER